MADMHGEALLALQYGMYIVSTQQGDKLNGQIATVVSQVTNAPVQIITCLAKENLTQTMLLSSRTFGVSVLERDTPMQFIGRFGFRSGRDIDKFDGVTYVHGQTGIPLVTEHAVATLEARVNHVQDVGTHRLFVADVVSAQVLQSAPVLTYAYYHTVIKGKSPKNAPTYVGGS